MPRARLVRLARPTRYLRSGTMPSSRSPFSHVSHRYTLISNPQLLHSQKYASSILPKIIQGIKDSTGASVLSRMSAHIAYPVPEQSRQTTYLVALAALIKVIPRAAYAHELPTVSSTIMHTARFCLLTLPLAHATPPSRAVSPRPYATRRGHRHAPLRRAGRCRGRVKDIKRGEHRFGTCRQPDECHVGEQRRRQNARRCACLFYLNFPF